MDNFITKKQCPYMYSMYKHIQANIIIICSLDRL